MPGFNPGIGIFQSRNPEIGKAVRDCNPYGRVGRPVCKLHFIHGRCVHWRTMVYTAVVSLVLA